MYVQGKIKTECCPWRRSTSGQKSGIFCNETFPPAKRKLTRTEAFRRNMSNLTKPSHGRSGGSQRETRRERDREKKRRWGGDKNTVNQDNPDHSLALKNYCMMFCYLIKWTSLKTAKCLQTISWTPNYAWPLWDSTNFKQNQCSECPVNWMVKMIMLFLLLRG